MELFVSFEVLKYEMMKRVIVLCGLHFLFAGVALSQGYKGEVDSMKLPSIAPAHYQSEYDIDKTINPGAWTNEKPGMHAAFGSEDELYFRKEVPAIKNEMATWDATGWKGERLNTQLVIWSPDTLQQVRVLVSDLKNEKGRLFSKENIQLNKVCYVLANYPYGSNEAVCGETPYKNAFLLPDRFEAFDRFDVPGKTVRPVWMSVNIPQDAETGTYTGTIDVVTANQKTILNVKIRVQDQTLPNPHDWHYRLDLWQNPWVIANYYNVKPWSEEHKALLKKHLQLYANAGGTYITTYGVHSPWGDNEYAIEGGMIDWIKQKNGSWRFDYTIFDEYVELAMLQNRYGEAEQYLKNAFQMDKDSVRASLLLGSLEMEQKQFKNNWNIFLTDLRTHLEKKGWFNKTYLGINENAMEQTLAAIKVIKAHSKDWKITYAGNWHPELDTLLNDYCFLYGYEAGTDEVKARTARGQTTTYYVCCNPAKPNNFLFSPPIEGRWISWYSAAHGYNGFLRWAYDAWPEDPMRDARYGSWPAGDCYLVYPGGTSCIRFEKLREGIVDYEKIRIIKELAANSPDASVENLLSQLNAHLAALNTDKSLDVDKLKNDVAKGKELVNELSDKLAHLLNL